MKSSFISRLRKDINIVSDEVSDLLHKEDVFQNRVKKLIEDHSIDPYVKSEVIRNHYSTAFTAVRRQVGTRQQRSEPAKHLAKTSKASQADNKRMVR